MYRELPDGTITMIRKDKKVEAFLNAKYTKIGDNRWAPSDYHPVEIFRDLFENTTVYIVGKGPSLDKLTAENFEKPYAPIIAINEAVHKIESLKVLNPTFVLTDRRINTMKVATPRHAYLLLYKGLYSDYERTYWYSVNERMSVTRAIGVCKQLGASDLIMYAFDAFTSGNTDYAAAIGIPSSEGGDPNRFLKQRDQILSALSGIQFSFRV